MPPDNIRLAVACCQCVRRAPQKWAVVNIAFISELLDFFEFFLRFFCGNFCVIRFYAAPYSRPKSNRSYNNSGYN